MIELENKIEHWLIKIFNLSALLRFTIKKLIIKKLIDWWNESIEKFSARKCYVITLRNIFNLQYIL